MTKTGQWVWPGLMWPLACPHITRYKHYKQAWGHQKVPPGAFWCLSPECGEERRWRQQIVTWQWAPGGIMASRAPASAVTALISPPRRRPTDKLKAVSNFGIPIFHISLFWQSEMFKSQIFTLDTSYEAPASELVFSQATHHLYSTQNV